MGVCHFKNKIADHICQTQKSHIESQLDDEWLSGLFDEIGHWQQGANPNAFDRWQNPHDTAENDEFWRILELCLDNLPQEQARTFLMKEYIELDSDEICTQMDITRQNLYVLLHRARLRLQVCLSKKWFV